MCCPTVACAGSGSPPRSPLRGAAGRDSAYAHIQQGSAGQLQLSEGGARPKVTKVKGSLSAPEGPVSLQLQQPKWQGAAGVCVAAAAASPTTAAGQQQQQPGGLQPAVSSVTDDYESFADANDRFSGSEAGSTASAVTDVDMQDLRQQQQQLEQQQQQRQRGEAEEEVDSSISQQTEQQVVLPYSEAELGAMIGGTLNRQYWESIHDGVGSVRDVYSIRGPHYLRDKKKIPAGKV